MNLAWDNAISQVTWVAIHVFLPFWFIVLSAYHSRFAFIPSRSLGRGLLISTLLMWPLMVGYRVAAEVPVWVAETESAQWNLSGSSGGFLVTGWFIALLLEIPYIMGRLLIDLRRSAVVKRLEARGQGTTPPADFAIRGL